MTSEKDVRYDGRFLRMVAVDHWEYVERANASGVVAILAVTNEEKLLLVEQFRMPLNAHVIEIPAGLSGDSAGSENEPLRTAAERELEEETGYSAGEMTFLGAGPSSAGLTDEVISFFHATGLTRVSDGGGDESESITVHEVPLTGLRQWLSSRTQSGDFVDPKIFAALAMAGLEFS